MSTRTSRRSRPEYEPPTRTQVCGRPGSARARRPRAAARTGSPGRGRSRARVGARAGPRPRCPRRRCEPELRPSWTSVCDQRVRLARAGGGGDERAVDLQRVDRELLQVGERGVAGAEVVDRDARRRRSQLAQQRRRRRLGVAHQRGLGDLERSAGRPSRPERRSAWWTVVTRPGSSSWRAETLTDMRIGVPAAAHCGGLVAGGLEHPGADVDDQPLSSASAMNSVGGTSPRVGCCQRSSASAAAISPVSRSRIGW